MSKYLVINFNRYETDKTTHRYVDAESFKEAILKVNGEGEARLDGYIDDMMTVSSDEFASIAEEESDILVYRMQPGVWHHEDHC